MISYFARCLEMDLPANEALGWREVARSWIPSCFAWQILLQWHGGAEVVPAFHSL